MADDQLADRLLAALIEDERTDRRAAVSAGMLYLLLDRQLAAERLQHDATAGAPRVASTLDTDVDDVHLSRGPDVADGTSGPLERELGRCVPRGRP